MQQCVVRGHQRRLCKPALRSLAAQHIAQRDKGHALVVRHVVFNHAVFIGMWLASIGKVNCVHKTKLAPGFQQLHAAQIGNGWLGAKHGGQQRGVGSHHFVAGRCAAQRKARHAER